MMDQVLGFMDIAKGTAKDLGQELSGFFKRDWTTTEKVLLLLVCLLLGMVTDMKHGKKRSITIGSNNGNHSGDIYEAPYEYEE